MWQHCLKEYSAFSSIYTSSGSGYYTNLDQSFSLQIGWSRHNHTENKDAEIHGMDIKVDAIQMMANIPEYMSNPTNSTGNCTR